MLSLRTCCVGTGFNVSGKHCFRFRAGSTAQGQRQTMWIELFDPFLFPASTTTTHDLYVLFHPFESNLVNTISRRCWTPFRVAFVEESRIEVSLKNRKLIISCFARYLPSNPTSRALEFTRIHFRNKGVAMIVWRCGLECQRFQTGRNWENWNLKISEIFSGNFTVQSIPLLVVQSSRKWFLI